MSEDGYHYWNASGDPDPPHHQQNERRSRLLSPVLPEVSSDTAFGTYDTYDTSDAFHLIVAAHDTLLTPYPDDEDFLRSGLVSPDEVQPPLTELKRMSLDDIQDPLQLQGEPLDLQLYLQDDEEPPLMAGALGFTPDPYKSQMAFSANVYDTASRDPYHSPQWDHPMAGPSSSLHTRPPMLPNLYPMTQSPTYPQDPALHSHPHLVSESQDISNSNRSSRKGYRHRHERVYGLPEEEQKKRSQILNNEASQLYRQRKSTKVQDIETQMKHEEERNVKLRMIYKQLQEQKQRFSLDQLP